MTQQARPHYGGDPVVLEEIPGVGITRAAGTTVPPNGSQGYAPGCLFHLLSNTTPNAYINKGTKASSDFKAIATA